MRSLARTLAGAAACLLTSSLSVLPADEALAQDLRELASRAGSSVVLLRVLNSFGAEAGVGSGFFVSEEGWIVTNYHVVEGVSHLEAVLADNTRLPVTGILAQDEVNDLAVIAVEPGSFSPLALATGNVEPGDPVVVLGGPLGLAGSLSEGIVSAVRRDEEGDDEAKYPWLQITAPISQGSSGSPVMNLDGSVVGVVVGMFVRGQNLNLAVPSAAVAALLDGLKPGQAPVSLGGSGVTVSASVYLRNVVVSVIFFGALVLGLRWLRTSA